MISSQSTPSTILDQLCLAIGYKGKTLDKELNSENVSSEVIAVDGNGKTNVNDSTSQKDSVLVTHV